MSDIMTQQHPITPPPELVRKWADTVPVNEYIVANAAARWGADRELKACCEWMEVHLHSGSQLCKQLRNARRPKPPSLKERALSEIAGAVAEGNITPERGATIRLALEALPE
jgi:hypothetical protein